MKIYISGPISILPIEEAKANFARSAELIREAGHEPVNPFDVCAHIADEAHYNEYLAEDIRALLGCEAIQLQPGWHRSRGARIENNIAHELGMKVIYEQPPCTWQRGDCLHCNTEVCNPECAGYDPVYEFPDEVVLSCQEKLDGCEEFCANCHKRIRMQGNGTIEPLCECGIQQNSLERTH